MPTMGVVSSNGLTFHEESFGSPSDPPVVLIAGLGAHSISWDDEFCTSLAVRGLRVVRFDNRDIGLSSHVAPEETYDLSDMAADTIGVMSALGIDRAHLVGRSMGGMIAQTVAIEHPERVLTLTSIFSNTGESEYGQARPDTIDAMIELSTPAKDASEAVERAVQLARMIGSPAMFDEGHARHLHERCAERNPDPGAVGRQMTAVMASGSRAAGLEALRLPTLVIHGDADPLVDVSGGRRTAELVPGAKYEEIAGMGHELPPVLWPTLVDLIAGFIAESTGA
jgi:pimeloyl-ACP methyl ester carboxylesterase